MCDFMSESREGEREEEDNDNGNGNVEFPHFHCFSFALSLSHTATSDHSFYLSFSITLDPLCDSASLSLTPNNHNKK